MIINIGAIKQQEYQKNILFIALSALFFINLCFEARADNGHYIQITNRIYIPAHTSLHMYEHQPAQFTVQGPLDTPISCPVTADNIEINFDLDGVILGLKPFDSCVAFLSNHSNTAIKFLGQYTWDTVSLIWKNKKRPAYELVAALDFNNGEKSRAALNQYEEGLGSLIDTMTDLKYIKKGMSRIINTLAAYDFVIRPATNQSFIEYERIAQRLPELFKHFSPGSYAHAREQIFIAKPSPAYFQEHILLYNIASPVYNPHGIRYAIFIDDRLENVKAAAEAGMIAIHFVDVRKLVIDFENLGIPAPSRYTNF